MATVNVTCEWSLDEEEAPWVIASALEEHYHVKVSRIATTFTFTVKGYGSYAHDAYKCHDADYQAIFDLSNEHHVLADTLAKLVVRLEKANATLDEAWSGDAVSTFDGKLGKQTVTLKELAQNLEFVAQVANQYATALRSFNQQWHCIPDTKFVYR